MIGENVTGDELLERLQSSGALPRDERVVVQTEHRLSGQPIETLLVDYGFVDAETLQALRVGVEQVRIDSGDFVPDAAAVGMLGEPLARRFHVLPLCFDARERVLTLALSGMDDLPLRDKLQRLLQVDGIGLQFVLAAPDEIAAALDRCYGVKLDLDAILDELVETRLVEALATTDSYQLPIVRLIDAILHDAVSRRASDIHLNPEEGYVRIRYRIDGVLTSVRCLHHRFWSAMVVRVKVLCDMDITETRSPQDGQFSKRIHGQRVDFRASSFPLRTGENIVLRVLDRRRAGRRLADLALPSSQLEQLLRIAHRPHGLIVVAGPTGSGKSTTLQALLGERDCEALNVMTLEEPVEHPMLRVRQASVNAARKLDFANGVRNLLRQDPDVLLIGEVRDVESCAMAFRAAMSGHQVLTSVHAEDTVSALHRLQELGAGVALQAGTLSAVISQRLLRRLCHRCSELPAPGCHFCHGSGYYGRQACVEVLEVTPALRLRMSEGMKAQALWAQAKADGLITLVEAAASLVSDGVTSIDEQDRVFGKGVDPWH